MIYYPVLYLTERVLLSRVIFLLLSPSKLALPSLSCIIYHTTLLLLHLLLLLLTTTTLYPALCTLTVTILKLCRHPVDMTAVSGKVHENHHHRACPALVPE